MRLRSPSASADSGYCCRKASYAAGESFRRASCRASPSQAQMFSARTVRSPRREVFLFLFHPGDVGQLRDYLKPEWCIGVLQSAPRIGLQRASCDRTPVDRDGASQYSRAPHAPRRSEGL